MDPKSLSHLDPKLRETYERVMGVAHATSQPAANTTPTSPIPADAPPAEAKTEESSASPSIFSSSPTSAPTADTQSQQPVSPTPYHVVEDVNTPPTAVADTQPAMHPLTSPATVAQMTKSNNAGPMLRVLYIVGAVVFFIIYTIFWIKVFNLPFFF